MRKQVLSLLLVLSCAACREALATDAVIVAPAATFAVPTLVGSFVTPPFVAPQAVQVVPQAFAVSPVRVAQVAIVRRAAVVRQPVRSCVRPLFRR